MTDTPNVSIGPKVYEDAMWLPWIQNAVLHKPGDSFYRTTKCGIHVGKDERARATGAYENDPRFDLCVECFA